MQEYSKQTFLYLSKLQAELLYVYIDSEDTRKQDSRGVNYTVIALQIERNKPILHQFIRLQSYCNLISIMPQPSIACKQYYLIHVKYL